MGYAKIRPRRGTLAEWTLVNPVLAEGEFVFEVPDTGVGTGLTKFKIGDGYTAYEDLPYAFDGAEASSINGGDVNDYSLICIRSGTTAEWEAADPILEAGEITYDSTTNMIKVGDGSSSWSQLEYISANADSATYAESAGTADSATNATYATSAGTATTATNATTAETANVAYSVNVNGSDGGSVCIKVTTTGNMSDSYVLEKGEMIYCTDTNTLYIGDGTSTFAELTGITGGGSSGDEIDLSEYVTKTQLSNYGYLDESSLASYLSSNGYVTITIKTASEWSSSDPVLAKGEIGYDSTNNSIKIGNGSSKWSALTFITASTTTGDSFDYDFGDDG